MRNKKKIQSLFNQSPSYFTIHNIYILIHPITKEPIYVGCTMRPLEKRLSHHLVASRLEPGSRKKHLFIRNLVNNNTPPLIVPLEIIKSHSFQEFLNVFKAEKEWIGRLGKSFKLLNTK